MATGFASVQRNNTNKNSGYKTLFERVSNSTGGEKKSLTWYRSAVKAEASKYKKNFNKYILDERKIVLVLLKNKIRMNCVDMQ